MELNEYTIKTPQLNGGKMTGVVSPLDKDAFKLQVDEIFVKQHYRLGKKRKDMVVIDCGANMGLASLYFKDWAKTIYAIEPSLDHFRALVENTRPYPNIRVFNQAIGPRNGWELLKSNHGGKIPETFWGDGDNMHKVGCVTLGRFMKENGIDHVDLLKMDVEGAEYGIFPSLGFESVADRIDAIVGEAHYIAHGNNLFIPEIVPAMLSEYSFKTKFRKIFNVFVNASLIDTERGGVVKTSVPRRSLFYAEKTTH